MNEIVSIIIPVFNSELYIEETLSSVEAQTYDNIEVLLIDNGSVDNSLQIIKDFSQKSRFSVKILEEKLKNASRARNKGFKNSIGRWVSFLDSDDLIEPQKIRNQVDFLKSNPQYDLVISDRIVFDSEMQNKLKSYTFENILLDSLNTVFNQVVITGNPLYKREVVDGVCGYDSKLRMAQDWDFHLRIAMADYKFGYLKGYFLKCRSRGDSLSSNWQMVSYIQEELIFEKYPVTLLDSLNDKSANLIFNVLSNNYIFVRDGASNLRLSRIKMVIPKLSKTSHHIFLHLARDYFLIYHLVIELKRKINLLICRINDRSTLN